MLVYVRANPQRRRQLHYIITTSNDSNDARRATEMFLIRRLRCAILTLARLVPRADRCEIKLFRTARRRMVHS